MIFLKSIVDFVSWLTCSILKKPRAPKSRKVFLKIIISFLSKNNFCVMLAKLIVIQEHQT